MHIVICDDDEEIAVFLKNQIDKLFNGKHTTNYFLSPFALQTYLDDVVHGSVDALIIDIDLGANNGIDIAKDLLGRYNHLKVIFATGFIKYATDIFSSEPTYFLVKPIDTCKLKEAINIVEQKIFYSKTRYFSFAVKGSVVKLDLSKILYFESRKRMVYVHTIDKVYEIYARLSTIVDQLPENYMQCHQSFIVNLNNAMYLENKHFYLKSGDKIPVSQSKYNYVRLFFTKFLGDSIWT